MACRKPHLAMIFSLSFFFSFTEQKRQFFFWLETHLKFIPQATTSVKIQFAKLCARLAVVLLTEWLIPVTNVWSDYICLRVSEVLLI